MIGAVGVTVQGLVVPVLRNVETMNYADIEKTIAQLGEKVRVFSALMSLQMPHPLPPHRLRRALWQ